jgi:hypothetical protein
MVVVVVVIVVVVLVRAGGIGAGFGIEWGFDVIDMAAEEHNHLLDDMVGTDADALAEQLDGEVPVAEVPGDADEVGFVVGVDFEEFFGAGEDADDSPVGQAQTVSVAKADGGWQVEENLLSGGGGECDTPAVAAVVVQQDFVAGVFERPGGQDFSGAHKRFNNPKTVGGTGYPADGIFMISV